MYTRGSLPRKSCCADSPDVPTSAKPPMRSDETCAGWPGGGRVSLLSNVWPGSTKGFARTSGENAVETARISEEYRAADIGMRNGFQQWDKIREGKLSKIQEGI